MLFLSQNVTTSLKMYLSKVHKHQVYKLCYKAHFSDLLSVQYPYSQELLVMHNSIVPSQEWNKSFVWSQPIAGCCQSSSKFLLRPTAVTKARKTITHTLDFNYPPY
jgi:hypothetical protein